MVGNPHVVLLKLNVDVPFALDVKQTLGGRQHVASAPDLDVDDNGKHNLVLLADDAGDHLVIV